MTRDELLAALLVERYDQTWWKTPDPWTRRGEPVAVEDDDVTRARRRRELLAAVDHTQIEEEETA
ncbi:MAG TPA: hypothetical protein VJL80_14575 [Aeromicrobium sp.]|nr:hypothetical protein [Aeromicrobium sp.]HKY59259.1 hypothetical protein [Aeromicrobium sp.]